jgi:hypothetical protein
MLVTRRSSVVVRNRGFTQRVPLGSLRAFDRLMLGCCKIQQVLCLNKE